MKIWTVYFQSYWSCKNAFIWTKYVIKFDIKVIETVHKSVHFYSFLNSCNTILRDKVCQWFAAGQWFYTGTLVYSTNKNDCDNTIEILLKLALNTNQSINQSITGQIEYCIYIWWCFSFILLYNRQPSWPWSYVRFTNTCAISAYRQ